jgi:hypothetical protein
VTLRTYREAAEFALARIEETIYADGVTYLDPASGERVTVRAPDRHVMRVAAELGSFLFERDVAR